MQITAGRCEPYYVDVDGAVQAFAEFINGAIHLHAALTIVDATQTPLAPTTTTYLVFSFEAHPWASWLELDSEGVVGVIVGCATPTEFMIDNILASRGASIPDFILPPRGLPVP